MTDVAAAAPETFPLLRRPVHAVRRPGRGAIAFAMVFAFVSVYWLMFFASADERAVFAPALAMANLSFLFLAVLYARDGVLPLFESGTLYVAATLLYSVFPLLNYAGGGMHWTERSDNRLQQFPEMTPHDVGTFSWRYVVYLASFIAVYLIARGAPRRRSFTAPRPDRATEVAILLLLFSIVGFFYVLGVYVGPIPSWYEGGTGLELRQRVPYVLTQITHVLYSMRFTAMQCVAVMLMSRWRSRLWRTVLFGWILVIIVSTTRELGARSELVLLFVTLGLLYHRYVRPVSLKMAAVGGALLVAAFLLLGVLRDVRGDVSEVSVSVLGWNNEFQVLWANAYDLHEKRATGEIAVPWQIYVADFVNIIPSQLLPFTKLDPSDWYADQLGLAGTGIGVMFGVIAQSVVGLDWIEVAVRGAVLALLFAWLHRFYVRHSDSFWITVFYLFVCVWSYYTFRATTFVLIYMILYQFVTVLIAAKVGAYLLRRGKRTLRRSIGSA